MTQKKRLVDIFSQINEAHLAYCPGAPNHVSGILRDLQSGAFFEHSERFQAEWLSSMEMVYLGRGECIWGLVESGSLPKDFPDEMHLAIMMYLLTFDCYDEEHKNRLRKRIADILNK